jgi:hypothetical protein
MTLVRVGSLRECIAGGGGKGPTVATETGDPRKSKGQG